MMFRMGGAEAFARQHVSMADNRQNDTRPIQPSQPPMASQIHPESHRPIADSPEWHGEGRPCDQCGEATEQFQVIVLVKQIAKITDGLVHVLISAPIVPGTIAALVMRAQVAVEHQSVEDAVQPLDGDAPRPVVRVRIQTGETFGDRQSDGRGLDLEEPPSGRKKDRWPAPTTGPGRCGLPCNGGYTPCRHSRPCCAGYRPTQVSLKTLSINATALGRRLES